MNPDTLWIVKITFGTAGGIFAVLAALFTLIDTSKEEKQENIKGWFRKKWNAINDSSWLTLPERATEWLFYVKTLVTGSLLKILERQRLLENLIGCVLVLLIIGAWAFKGIYLAMLSLVLVVVTFCTLGLLIALKFKKETCEFVYLVILSVLFIGTSILWMLIILKLSIGYATLVMAVLLPFYWVMLASPASFFLPANLDEGPIVLFFIGVVAGFTITLLSLMVGHITDPIGYVPQTFQMLLSNVVFDGLTMVITFKVLGRALVKNSLFSLPIVACLIIMAAGILAIGSLYFGLVFTDKALTFKELLHILIARSSDGSRFELSPYFWTMHTTFIPTLLYLLFILFCWIAKALLIPVRWFFGRGQEHKNPLKLTATLCALVSVTFGALYFTANEAYQTAKEHKILNEAQPLMGSEDKK